ncbi:MAG: hypothetical protein IPK26_20685 [Planctomycetes bacterium]|nr:hypothetical protein [Planctomycetota bacterium]
MTSRCWGHWSRVWLLATGIAVGQQPEATAVVTVIDAARKPQPQAVVWWLHGKAWERRKWIPAETGPWCHNPHELLRRLGERQVADDHGVVRVPAGATVAGELGELAGVVTTAAGGGPTVLEMDDCRWTIELRDRDGKPVGAVPIGADGDPDQLVFGGLPLGLTDAEGRLVVRAPASVPLARFMPRPIDGSDPKLPESVTFGVEGMFLARHEVSVPLRPRASLPVRLTMPHATRVEVQVPDWHGPIVDCVSWKTEHKGLMPDFADSWLAAGRSCVWVGAIEAVPTPVRMVFEGSDLSLRVDVPRLEQGQVHLVEPAFDAGDIIVRARLRTAQKRPARYCVLIASPASKHLRTPWVRADREGRLALVLRPDLPADTVLEFAVDATPDPAVFGCKATLRLDGLRAGDRRDFGLIELKAP